MFVETFSCGFIIYLYIIILFYLIKFHTSLLFCLARLYRKSTLLVDEVSLSVGNCLGVLEIMLLFVTHPSNFLQI